MLMMLIMTMFLPSQRMSAFLEVEGMQGGEAEVDEARSEEIEAVGGKS